MAYIVTGMTLIPQTVTEGCWYASAKMLIAWRRGHLQMTEASMRDPSEDPASAALYASNSGIENPQILPMAKRLGLESIPPMSPTEGAIESWLRKYGPLWVNGKTHIVVISGINGNNLQIYNPAPVGSGGIQWLTFDWYIGGSPSSRDTGADVETVFLHCPR
jgi:hypothetical protein